VVVVVGGWFELEPQTLALEAYAFSG
jgi:hypothetical protein